MADSTVTLPAEVVLTRAEVTKPRFTPRELQTIKAQTGRTLSELFSDETSDEKFTVFAWLKLRREGHDVSWEEVLDVVLVLDMTDAVPAPDPTNGRRPTT